MEIKLSHYDLFLSLMQGVMQAHELDEYVIGINKRTHIKHRTLLLMKFDILLDRYRAANNSRADHLHGKNAAIVMCCEKLKLAPSVVKKFSLDDFILTLHTDINNFKITDEIMHDIRNPYPAELDTVEEAAHQLGEFKDSEWDPELRYRLIAEARRRR